MIFVYVSCKGWKKIYIHTSLQNVLNIFDCCSQYISGYILGFGLNKIRNNEFILNFVLKRIQWFLNFGNAEQVILSRKVVYYCLEVTVSLSTIINVMTDQADLNITFVDRRSDNKWGVLFVRYKMFPWSDWSKTKQQYTAGFRYERFGFVTFFHFNIKLPFHLHPTGLREEITFHDVELATIIMLLCPQRSRQSKSQNIDTEL